MSELLKSGDGDLLIGGRDPTRLSPADSVSGSWTRQSNPDAIELWTTSAD